MQQEPLTWREFSRAAGRCHIDRGKSYLGACRVLVGGWGAREAARDLGCHHKTALLMFERLWSTLAHTARDLSHLQREQKEAGV